MADGTRTLASGAWAHRTQLPGRASGNNAGIERRNHVSGAAQDGSNFVELDTAHDSVALQPLSTIAGAKHDPSFCFAARPGTASRPAGTNNIAVDWNNTLPDRPPASARATSTTGCVTTSRPWAGATRTRWSSAPLVRATPTAARSTTYRWPCRSRAASPWCSAAFRLPAAGGRRRAPPPRTPRTPSLTEILSGRLRRHWPHRGLGADPIAGVLGLGQALQVADDRQPHCHQHRQQGGEAGECE